MKLAGAVRTAETAFPDGNNKRAGGPDRTRCASATRGSGPRCTREGLVVDAVWCQPVCKAGIPENGENKQGISQNLGVRPLSTTGISACIQRLRGQFPMLPNREFLCA